MRAAAGPAAVPGLRELLGDRLRTGELRPDGRCEIEADGPSVEILVAQLAGAGADVEVLEPPEARARLARLGQEIAAAHGGAPGGGSPAPETKATFL